jgi:hypothetical protein
LFYAIRVLAQSLPQSSETAKPGAPTFDAAQLELVGHLGGNARTISIQGNRAYLGIDTMLVVLDITDPAHPVPLGRTFFPATVLGIQVISNYVYVATGNAGLWVVNVTNPGAPEDQLAGCAWRQWISRRETISMSPPGGRPACTEHLRSCCPRRNWVLGACFFHCDESGPAKATLCIQWDKIILALLTTCGL